MSLLLLVATLVLWVRSFHVGESIRLTRRVTVPDAPLKAESHAFELCSAAGGLAIVVETVDPFDSAPQERIEKRYLWLLDRYPDPTYPTSGRPKPSLWNYAGLAFSEFAVTTSRSRFDQRNLTIRWPVIVSCTTLAPLLWVWRRARRRRHKNGCPTCSYNLTGNTSGVCPECGKSIPSSAATAEQKHFRSARQTG
jgi:hypothetical protein